MTTTTPTPRTRSTGRRRVSSLLALGLAATGSVVGVLTTTGPAVAGEGPSCSFGPVQEADGAYSSHVTTSEPGFVMAFLNGSNPPMYGDTVDNQDAPAGPTLAQLAPPGATTIELRWYPISDYPGGQESTSEITTSTPYYCNYVYTIPGGDPLPDPLPQTVDLAALDLMRIGAAAQSLTATSNAGRPVTFSSATPSICTVDTVAKTVTPVGIGWCTVDADADAGLGTDDLDYAAADTAQQSFQVLSAALSQHITFAQPADLRLIDPARQLDAAASSELPVDYRSTTPDVCTVTPLRLGRRPAHARTSMNPAGVVTPASVGTCTIVASQAGNAALWIDPAYQAAADVSRSFRILGKEVALQGQQITVSGDHGVALSSGRADVRFTVPSTSDVKVRSTTPAVCGWDGRANEAVVLHKAGTCELTATATADATYAAAAPVTATFPVWGTPIVPARATAPRVLDVLGRGEGALRVRVTPAGVCRTVAGQVALTGAGRCRVTVVDQHGSRVRATSVRVAEPAGATASKQDMDLVGSIRFDFLSSKLKAEGKRTLRHLAPKLRKAQLVVVYGNTQAYGAGDTPANRHLSARRAKAVVKYLRGLGVEARATTVAMASRNPTGKGEAANRRADIYWIS